MKVAVLLSGGVDSSVAMCLLKEQGHDLTAFYLKIWLEDELAFLGECPWEEDLKYARGVCEQLGIPLQIVSLQREYFEKVVAYTIAELKAGYTPSPDIFCNQRIKFGVFFEKIDESYDKVATGHYARVEIHNGSPMLKIGPDPVKDQTYFLAHLDQRQLSRALFPVGDKLKSDVRAIAKKHGLLNCDRKDSQGICFLGKIKFDDFVRYHLGEKKGPIIEVETSKKLGEHDGYWYHTIGQRRGLRLSGGPWYVVGKDIVDNIIYVSHYDHVLHQSQNCFTVGNFNWITHPLGYQLRTKIRHGTKFYDCQIMWKKGEYVQEDECALVEMTETDQGIAPGQFAVFYEGDTCLGCAKIQYSLRGSVGMTVANKFSN